ncbi:MAG TPA: aromatic ring-hydroxylating dioxygenase subunit alpha [Steroidobacteraceae bacterium]|jgi:Rieske 2Fe-2S family protein
MSNPSDTLSPAYNGLTELTAGLPASAYFDHDRYVAELRKIWQRNWIYVARSSEIAGRRAFATFEIGDQKMLLVRDDQGVLRGFYNTCRHRGALLCRESGGTLRSGAIVCPYHAWVYDLEGALLRTSSKIDAQGFDVADYPLYPIQVKEWRGFVFVALTDSPPPLERSFDMPLQRFDAWPLEDLRVAHTLRKTIACNWKIFWENYNECLHCPSVHPQLSALVPIYGRGLLEERDDPEWSSHATDKDPKFKGGLRSGAESWTVGGALSGRPFPNVSTEDRALGAVYLTGLPSIFLVGHADYVRVVRLWPLGPERTQLTVEYLFSAESLADPSLDIAPAVEFTNRVMTEDAEVCELNQGGLKSSVHAQGVVMPEEYVIKQFHAWVNAELARP